MSVEVLPVHTIGTSVANGKNSDIDKADFVKKKYRNLTARKFFTSVLAAKISAYEEQRIKEGKPVGKWVTNCSHEIKKGIRENVDIVRKEVTYRDNSKELFELHTKKYGYMNGDEMVIHPHQRRWIKLFNCGSKIEKLTNKEGKVFFADKNHDCGDKMCMRCNRKKSFMDFVKYKKTIMAELDNPVMLVLHHRNPKSYSLSDTLHKMYSDLRSINKQNSKDFKKGKVEKYSYYWSFEMTINPSSKSFHPHFHIIVEQRLAQKLLNEWISKDSQNRTHYAHRNAISDPFKDESDLIECFKYVTKISVDEIDANGNSKVNADGKSSKELAPIPMIYEMLMVIYDKHRNGAVGKIYNNRLTNDQSKDKIVLQVIEQLKDEGFDEGDNPLVDLCEKWFYDHDRTDYIGLYNGIEFPLSNYKPTQKTKDFLRIP